MASDDDYGPAMNDEFFESCISDLQHGTQNSLVPFATTTQHPFPSIPGPNVGMPLYDVGPSFQSGREWDLELQRNGTDGTVPLLLNHQSPNNACQVSDISLEAGRPSSSISYGWDTVGPTAAVERPLKQRRIMPKSMDTASEMTAVVGAMNASVQTAKRLGRKGGLTKKKKDKASKMRKKTACAACFASHLEVSFHRCDCRTVLLTVIQVFYGRSLHPLPEACEVTALRDSLR
jgi:hypothetical protein